MDVALYSETRNEYMKQLCVWIVPSLVDFFRNEYNRIATTHGKKAMSLFQIFCSEVPKWNQDVIELHINGVLDGCRCDYVEELMTAVFIAHTKMLTSIRTSAKQKKLQITLPKLDHFLHRVFTECARTLWKAPYLFATELSAVERQKNVIQAESMCTEAMSAAVRSLLPVKNILREYLDEEETESEKQKEAPLDFVEEEEGTPETPPVIRKQVIAVELAEPVESVESVKPVESVNPVEPLPPADSNDTSAEPPKSPKPKKQSLLLTKMESPPGPAIPVGSDHVVELPNTTHTLTLEKSDAPVPTHLTIETEPAVHFTPYDTVFEDKTGKSTIEYAPKISVEDKPPSTWGLEDDGGSNLVIGDTSSAISLDEIEDLEAPVIPVGKPEPTVAVLDDPPIPTPDIDAPLSTTGDFEELT